MLKTVIVVAVLAFALQCVLADHVAEHDSTEAAVIRTDPPSTHSNNVSSTTTSSPNVTTTVSPSPSNGASSAGNCVLFAQVFATALALGVVSKVV